MNKDTHCTLVCWTNSESSKMFYSSRINIFLSFYFVFCLLIPSNYGWEISSTSEMDSCAEVFLQENFQGRSIRLDDREQVPDLRYIEEKYYLVNNNASQESLSNFTMSVKVTQGCKFITAEKRFLKGKKTEFDTTVESVSTATYLLPRSVSCLCPKICKCEDAVLRQRECARAYIDTDCSNCESYFTPLLQGTRREFPPKWQDKVAAILVRKGCSVNLSVHNGIGGNENVNVIGRQDLNGNQIKEWNQTISHYECSCSSAVASSKRKSEPRNPTYPEMVSIPKTKSDLLQILKNGGMKNHPGILSALQSSKSGRSTNTAYILLLGLTGSGKSTAINQLFDHPNITKVGGRQSTTTDIHEYHIRVRLDELGIKNSELSVIDTPGISDTRGIVQDARFLTTLDNFLANHEDLKDRLPNVVLIFSKFNDNRFHGDGSSFVKMLRTIDLFKDRIIDKRHTNVIFVLSHFMSERADITRSPTERIQNVRKAVEEFSAIPKPINIVVAENKPEEAQLPSLNGFYLLPNGEYYPKNLFDEMQRVVITGGDPLGEAVIRTGFKDSDYFRIIGKRYPLVGESHPQVTKYLGILSSFDQPLDTTQVSSLLTASYAKMEPGLKKEYPGVLSHLQRLFFHRNIHETQNIPKTTTEILKFFQDVHINDASLFLLNDALNLRVPTFGSNLLVGSGYNLINDQPLSSPAFKTDLTFVSNIGFQISKGFQSDPYNQMERIYYTFKDRISYATARLSDLGVDASSVSLENLKGNIKNGYNILNPENSNELLESGKLSAVMEYRMFEMKLVEAELQLFPDFKTSLQNLTPLNQSDWDNIQNWNNFFEKYGTHLVTSAFGGGQITISLKPKETFSDKIEEYSLLTDSMGKIVQHLADNLMGLSNHLYLNGKVGYEIIFEGGDKKYSNVDNEKGLEEIDINGWKDSIYYNPVMLSSSLKLLPVSGVARTLGNSAVAQLIEEAASALFNASLVYVPAARVPHAISSRDRTFNAQSYGQGDYQMAQEFANIFKGMSEQSARMQERVLDMMAENERKSQERADLIEKQKVLDQEIRLQENKMNEERRNNDTQEASKREALYFQRMQEMDQLRANRTQLDVQLQQQRFLALQEIQSKQQTQMMEFISVENDKMRQIAQNKKPIWQEITGVITTAVGGITDIVKTFSGGKLMGATHLGIGGGPQGGIGGGHPGGIGGLLPGGIGGGPRNWK